MSAYGRVISGAYDLWKANGTRLEAAKKAKLTTGSTASTVAEAIALATEREREAFEALCNACDEVRTLLSARAAAAPVPQQTEPTGPEAAQ